VSHLFGLVGFPSTLGEFYKYAVFVVFAVMICQSFVHSTTILIPFNRALEAIVATAKEILVIIWYVLTRRELCRHMNRDRYEQKLSRLKKIKESAI
jgi:hypothetical protein